MRKVWMLAVALGLALAGFSAQAQTTTGSVKGTVVDVNNAVVAGAKRSTDHHGEFGHVGVRDGMHHLGAVFGDAPLLVLFADHETGDVLQEEQRDATRRATSTGSRRQPRGCDRCRCRPGHPARS